MWPSDDLLYNSWERETIFLLTGNQSRAELAWYSLEVRRMFSISNVDAIVTNHMQLLTSEVCRIDIFLISFNLCFGMCVGCACLCVYIFSCEWAHVCAYVWLWKPEVDSVCSPWSFPHDLLDRVSNLNPKLADPTWLTGWLALGIPYLPGFYVGAGDQNFSPVVCTALFYPFGASPLFLFHFILAKFWFA